SLCPSSRRTPCARRSGCRRDGRAEWRRKPSLPALRAAATRRRSPPLPPRACPRRAAQTSRAHGRTAPRDHPSGSRCEELVAGHPTEPSILREYTPRFPLSPERFELAAAPGPSHSRGVAPSSRSKMDHETAEGAELVIDGRPRVFYEGYWIKAYPIPSDTLLAKRRLIETLA